MGIINRMSAAVLLIISCAWGIIAYINTGSTWLGCTGGALGLFASYVIIRQNKREEDVWRAHDDTIRKH